MKNRVNNLRVFRYKRVPIKTCYPQLVVTEKGKQLTHVIISNMEINVGLKCSDFSLESLLSAGVDPASMNIHTSSSKVDAFVSLGSALQGVELPPDVPSSDTVIDSSTSDK